MPRTAAVAGLAVFFGLATTSQALAQRGDARNRLYGEAFGPGFVASLNYERQVSETLSVRVGAGGWPQSGFRYVLGLGMGLVRLGGPEHSAYLGLGGGVAWFEDVDLLEQTDVVGGYAIALAAYQFQHQPGGFFLRLSYTPMASTGAIAPLWGGVSLGWAW